MNQIPGLETILSNLKDWLWYSIIARYWWVTLIALALVLLYLAINWAEKKKQEFQNQIEENLDQSEDKGLLPPKPPSSL
jgi:hypothetical protein